MKRRRREHAHERDRPGNTRHHARLSHRRRIFRQRPHHQCAERDRPQGRERQNAGHRRRIGLREIHPRPHHDDDRRTHLRRAADRRQAGGDRQEGRGFGNAPQGADRVPEPLWLAEPAPEDRRCADGTAHHQREGSREGAARTRHGNAPESRLAGRALQPLSAYVLRRPAPAHRHRARADAEAAPAGAGRAGFRARPFGAGAGSEPSGGPAGRVRPHLCLHQPRPFGGALYRRRGDGDVFRRSVEYGTRDAVFTDPQHEYTQSLFAATPRADVESIRKRLAEKAA
ncbi:Dipeptide ABC transporter permease/ATPase [Nitratireductor aquibiodomus RA22]|uniref:Dipeptide ABC transporter permease/ATPase n=1 Tax=Nitratireductor aquibiodomus RA22 TaxID=1189611 RepID=I5BXR7_9HYPH|nr:Dipeptide ABC transporter permease/ATPase [Nitratireductor aquibiodomus RA22]